MECPFELPVRLNKKGHFVCGEGKSYRDLTPRLSMLSQNKTYIVCAINSHEKLVEACNHAYSFMICVTNLDNNENLKWQEDVTEKLKRAL